jgi:hypothetical protein
MFHSRTGQLFASMGNKIYQYIGPTDPGKTISIPGGWVILSEGNVYNSIDNYRPLNTSLGATRLFSYANDCFHEFKGVPVRGVWKENNQFIVVIGFSTGMLFIDQSLVRSDAGLAQGVGSYFVHMLESDNIAYGQYLDYIDTYLLLVKGQQLDGGQGVPATPASFAVSESNSLTFPDLYIATTTGDPNYLRAVKVLKRHAYFFGQYRTEIWYVSGDALFPLAEIPQTYIEYGCDAFGTICTHGDMILMLGQTRNGVGIVVQIQNGQAVVVSDHSVELALQRAYRPFRPEGLAAYYSLIGGDPAIAARQVYPQPTAFIYSIDRHVFYQLTFRDETWVLDLSTGQWGRVGATDETTGVLHKHLAQCAVNYDGAILFGSAKDGKVYFMDLEGISDAGGVPVVKTCGFGSIQTLVNGMGQAVAVDGAMIQITRFVVDMETGLDPVEQTVGLRYSVDRGRTFGELLAMSMGANGEYQTQPMWRLSAYGRDIRFEIEWSGPGSLNGAYVDATLLADT